MSYKKYIKRGGKLYGPYIYHSKRVGDKVISEYVGKGDEEKSRVKKISVLKFLVLVSFVVLLIFLAHNFSLIHIPVEQSQKLSPYNQVNASIGSSGKEETSLFPYNLIKINTSGMRRFFPLTGMAIKEIRVDENETREEPSLLESQDNLSKQETETKEAEINETELNETETTEVEEIEIETEIEKTDKEVVANETEESTSNLTEVVFKEVTIKSQVVIGRPVKWVKNVSLEKPGKIRIELPKEAKNIIVKKIEKSGEEVIKEEISKEKIKITGEGILDKSAIMRFLTSLLRSITGKAIQETFVEENLEIIIEENATVYEIEYETPGPVADEEEIPNGKRINISSDVHYEDVLAYTYLPKEAEEEKVKLFWIVNDSRKEIPVDKYDSNGNGLIDYVEWVVPSLSSQTYEVVIEISKAEHLDENREFVSDIYDEVKERDDVWSEVINPGEYVRVTFERKLDFNRDITLYARSSGDSPAKIEVYEKDGTDIIAKFENILEESWYKVYLSDLKGSQDVFDLRVVGGGVELDYVVDPTTTVNPDSDVSAGAWSTTGVDHYTEIDEGLTPDTSDYIWIEGVETAVDVFGMADPSLGGGTATEINISVYADVPDGPGNTRDLTINISTDGGVSWEGGKALTIAFMDPMWYSVNYSGSWSSLSGLQVEVGSNGGDSGILEVYTLYANITYSAGGGDSTPPDLTLDHPQNTTYDYCNLSLNVSSTATDIDTWIWSNDSFTTNYSFTPNTSIVWEDGQHTLHVDRTHQ